MKEFECNLDMERVDEYIIPTKQYGDTEDRSTEDD